ncbi:helix-turn-helix domain-containing protein [Pantoea sp. App145]|uniref:helix-turn-helix domain-containing protein n=2 Tax=unclassified Pantoea TaxID=2630326 RepID=UPI003A7F75CC
MISLFASCHWNIKKSIKILIHFRNPLKVKMAAIDRIIAERLRQLRKSYGWSLSEAERMTGVSKSMLGQIERGESSPTLATIEKISVGFKLTLKDFLNLQ